MSCAPAGLPSQHVRLEGAWLWPGLQCALVPRLQPRAAVKRPPSTQPQRQPQRHPPPGRPLRGRAQRSPCSIAVCGPEYASRKILRMQGEYQRGRAQVVEAYREKPASTTNSRQGQYITTTSGTTIRRPGGMCSRTRLGLKAGSTPMRTLVETHFLMWIR
jgi:hypothetical protein